MISESQESSSTVMIAPEVIISASTMTNHSNVLEPLSNPNVESEDVRVNPQDDSTTLPKVSSYSSSTAPADFAVTVHEEEEAVAIVTTSTTTPSTATAVNSSEAAIAPEINDTQQRAVTLPSSSSKDTKARPALLTNSNHRRRRKRARGGGRLVRTVSVTADDDDNDNRRPHHHEGVALPPHHYECTLYRRAIRKSGDASGNVRRFRAQDADNVDQNDDESTTASGDVSLGMKLTVIGGKVIVQQLNPLDDGRASPAQLAGVVQRGDVLLSINGSSLVNLPIDQLMRGLSPLSTPDSNGVYPKVLRLRFASKEGLFLLNRSLGMQSAGGTSNDANRYDMDGAAEMFGLFPMVDQLSGVPLFETHRRTESPTPRLDEKEPSPATPRRDDDHEGPTITTIDGPILTLDEQISCELARDRQRERERSVSEYFAWRDDSFSEILRGPPHADEDEDDGHASAETHQPTPTSTSPPLTPMTLNQFIERGRRAVIGARALSDKIEAVDRGKDGRSLKSWKSTISLYSRASARRRAMQTFDTASVPANFLRLEEEDGKDDENDDDNLSGDSSHSDDGQPMEADAHLLRLAATDAVWRQQVLQYLEKVMEEREKVDRAPEHDAEVGDTTAQPETNMDAALSTELGSFLFGDNMSKILTKQKKSQALPPDEITALLFDLTTKLNATIPEEVAATGSQGSQQSSITPYMEKNRTVPTPGSDVQIASRFLLEDVLPAWLKSFKPLPWEQRRILWPLDKPVFGGSTTASSTFSDDSFTLESVGVSSHLFSTGSPKAKRTRNLRERIEDMELNAESRAETCFLATHYFTQKLLPRSTRYDDLTTEAQNDVLSFVRTFGSYLKLHTCLVHAAAAHARDVINSLLELARHDPRHKEFMKLGVKPHMLVFYEPTMLSSILERLQSIKNGFAPDMWLATIDLCAASFPDVQPWQVQTECAARDGEDFKNELEDLYYIYLSQLLHPMDGHEMARKDRDLVREWCELSIRCHDHGTFKERSPDRRRNFFCVASRTSSAHLLYSRDLVSLLQMSKEVGDSELELDIVGEILEPREDITPNTTIQRAPMQVALDHLRLLVNNALESFEDRDSPIPAVRKLKRTLRIYQTASRSSPDDLHVPRELLRWIRHLSKVGGRRRTLKLVRFLADEANPTHVVEATHAWTIATSTTSAYSADGFEVEFLPVLQTVLFRAAHQPAIGSADELSGVLSKLRRARQRLQQRDEEETIHDPSTLEMTELLPAPNIWARMATGMVPVLK